MSTTILHDDDLMPYGKYAGTEMSKVPVQYLIWLHDNRRASANIERYIYDHHLMDEKFPHTFKQKRN